jgi:hypothetical protein
MALESTELSIGSTRYQLTALPAAVGRKTLVRLLKIVGPSVAALFRGRGQVEAKEAATVSGDAIANAIQELSERMTEDDLEYLVGTFTRSTEVMAENGFIPLEKAGTFGLFARDYGSMLQWILASIDWNYSSFLAVLKSTGPQK